MSDKSAIEWTDATWNIVTGCSLVSPACTNCYAMRLAGTRLKHLPSRRGLTREVNGKPVWTGEIRVNWEWIELPFQWARARKIFVAAHGDLFHAALSMSEIATIFAVMVAAHHLRGHVSQVLTKRAERMREVLSDLDFWEQVNAEAEAHVLERTDPLARRRDDARATLGEYGADNPPPGIWIGVTAEDQQRADERIPDLLATPAAVRFVSCEPLLGHIRLDRIEAFIDDFRDCGGHPDPHWPSDTQDCTWLDSLRGKWSAEAQSLSGERRGNISADLHHTGRGLDWVIAGGETGPGARPAHPDWLIDLRDQCAAAHVPFFFKQWGEWKNGSDFAADALAVLRDGRVIEPTQEAMQAADRESAVPPQHPTMMRRVGKTRAGRLLAGREHNEFPRSAA